MVSFVVLMLIGECIIFDLDIENYWFCCYQVVYQWLVFCCMVCDVLEVGCGEGYGVDLIVCVVCQVIVVDYDEIVVVYVWSCYF